jgi:hypothetical protein
MYIPTMTEIAHRKVRGSGVGMRYLATNQPRRKPALAVKGPKLLPSRRAISRQVVADEALWAQLGEAAEFHGDVFKAMDADEKVSRNDIVVSFLEWALQEYWDDKGGKPTSKTEWAEKVKKHAETLRAGEAAPKK